MRPARTLAYPGPAMLFRGGVLEIAWLADLALWATRREGRAALPGCVVNLTAPELTPGQLAGACHRDRRHRALDAARLHFPRGGRRAAAACGYQRQARAVQARGAERGGARRRICPAAAEEAVAAGRHGSVPGLAEVWRRFTRLLTAALWTDPGSGHRWA